jgi:hypothetical protein
MAVHGDEASVLLAAARRGEVKILEWLSAHTSPWSAELKQEMLWHAGYWCALPTAKWLRETQQAAWPLNFHGTLEVDDNPPQNDCWTAAMVKWALESGCTWGAGWSCQLAPAPYICNCKYGVHNDSVEYTASAEASSCSDCVREQAQALFAWAHKNGCPCTCEAAAAL